MGLDITVWKLKKEPTNHFEILDQEKGFPQWTLKYAQKKKIRRYDWDKWGKDNGYKIAGNEDDFSISGYYNTTLFLTRVSTGENIKVNLKKIPIIEVEESVIYYDEVGYQRKGFNSQFYKDYEDGKIGYYVWSKKDLETYKDKYCVNDETKEYFQKYILDSFVDKECFATFSW